MCSDRYGIGKLEIASIVFKRYYWKTGFMAHYYNKDRGEGIELTLRIAKLREVRGAPPDRNYKRQCQGHRRQVLPVGRVLSRSRPAREHNGATSASRSKECKMSPYQYQMQLKASNTWGKKVNSKQHFKALHQLLLQANRVLMSISIDTDKLQYE
ncbi:hypothetical protein CEXT_81 [Caerostris extrusa]|uniref:Uncharacterized protein n=1 Tax=Caerostris extrusa TaxID=172846 RepID=A0AAV4WNP2_CAEEX|nr:hypothetical protein CEXT_81 [Caerostris extrusa]